MKEQNPLSLARTLLEDGQLDTCLSVIKSHWLSNLNDPEAAALLADLMSEAGHPELADRLQTLADKHKELSVNPLLKDGTQDESKALFEAGYGLIDVRQYELAAMLLDRCTRLAPDEPVANYELGFSLMSLGRCAEAVRNFEKALAHLDDFDTRLNLAVCYTLLRRNDQAREMVDRMAGLSASEEETKELNHRRQVLKRMDSLKSKAALNARDWLYILYGSILIRPQEHTLGQKEDLASLAAMLATLKGVLEGLPAEIEAIEFYNPRAKAMARALAEFMELPLDSYRGPVRPDKALLVLAWAPDVIGPHQAFVANTLNRNIFAYAMSTKEPLPVCPDMVGCFCDESELGFVDSGTQDTVSAKMLERARNLESNPDIIKAVRDAIEYYSDKRDLLILSNPEHFPERPEFTAEIQKQDGGS